MDQHTTDTATPPGFVREEVLIELAQVLAHRLRGLVASIEGFTDLLTDTLHGREQRDLALRILEGSARIESVLSDLQRYGEPVQPVQLPLYPIEVTESLLAPLPDDARARVEVTSDLSPDEEVLVAADPFLLRQALLVLVQNALEANRRDGQVRVRLFLEQEEVHFEVWNAGFLDFEDAERRVFEPFFTTKASNLGVGLPMAKRIARAHGGRVRLVGNDPECGIRFALSLPVSDGDEIP